MEGSYMTKDQRTKIAQQVRATHFKLGGNGPDYNTVSRQVHYPMQGQNSQQDKQFVKSIKQSHFHIGSGQSNPNRKSEFAHEYTKKWVGYNKQKQNTGEISDMRAHYYKFGMQSPAYATTHQQEYYNKNAQLQGSGSKDLEKLRANIRKHSFVMGDDQANRQSVFKQDYQAKRGEVAQQATHAKNDLRNSHFSLGNAPGCYESISKSAYTKKNADDNAFNQQRLRELQSSHFHMGDNGPQMATTHQASFNQKAGGRQDLNTDKLNDLRASHFELGTVQAHYAPMSTTFHNQKPLTANQAAVHSDNSLRTSHFQLGADKPQWQTSHRQNFIPRTMSANNRLRDASADKASHIHLGPEPAYPMTTSQAAFKPKSIDPQKIDPTLLKNLRHHHFELGDGQGRYATEYGQLGRGKGQPGGFNKATANDLRASHLRMGGDPAILQSKSHMDYRPHTTGTGQADPGLIKDLRRNHFDIGMGNLKGITEYQGSYHWVKPVKAPEVKFSLGD